MCRRSGRASTIICPRWGGKPVGDLRVCLMAGRVDERGGSASAALEIKGAVCRR